MINWQERIVNNPNVLFGKPTIKGTRIGVDLILERLVTTYTIEDLLDAYPSITKEDILACLLFVAEKKLNN